jgi:archaellum biogenesis protein FlaJ (TadC family)
MNAVLLGQIQSGVSNVRISRQLVGGTLVLWAAAIRAGFGAVFVLLLSFAVIFSNLGQVLAVPQLPLVFTVLGHGLLRLRRRLACSRFWLRTVGGT